MATLGEIGRRLWMLAHRRRNERDLDEEMRLHEELLAGRGRRDGATTAAADSAARRRFGSPLRIREDTHEALGWLWVEDLAQDLRYGVRALAGQKGFTATVVLTLGLGIGVTTGIFSIVSGVILRPLPFAQPDRLVQLFELNALSPEGSVMSSADLDEYQHQSTSFDALAQYEVTARYLRGPGAGERQRAMAVGTERTFFSMLGVGPIAGRTFSADDPANVAVVGEAFWRQRLGGDAGIVGSSVLLDDEPFTIIGVMPESFQFPYGAASLLPGVATEGRTDLWRPFAPPGQRAGRASVVGRLKPGVPIEVAESELQVIAARIEAESPRPLNQRRGVRVAPLSEVVVAPPVRRRLLLLFGAVGLVLVLALANVTNLSLVRLTVRRREMALRSALGAGPLRLVRQLLTESLLVTLLGGALGLALAWWASATLTGLAGPALPRAHEVALDWRVFLFLLCACVGTGVLVGMAPALIARRTTPQSVLQEGSGRSTMGAGQRRLRDGLIVGEVALAFALAVGAAVLIRELVRLRNTDSGMVTSQVITFHLGQRMTPGNDGHEFYEIAERVSALPGVRSAGFVQLVPLQSWGWMSNSNDLTMRGRPPLSPIFQIGLRYVTPDYFRTLGIPILRGRGFTVRDTRDAPRVILINEALARRYFGDADPVGVDTTRGTIAGVVGDVRQVSLDQPAGPELYYPIAQNWSQVSDLGMSLIVATEGRPETAIDPVRAVVREISPNQAIFNVKTMDRVVSDSLSDFTLFLTLIASFAGLAVMLAMTGTYGVIAYVAASRAREFGIRVALGADRARIVQLVLGQGLTLTALGLGLGIAATLAVVPLLSGLPVSIRGPSAITVVPVAILVCLVALGACLPPAYRAAEADPMTVLRGE